MTKQQLLQQLAEDTWVTLRPSGIHGIGVFALRDIPRGCKTIFSRKVEEWLPIPISEVEQLPDHSRAMIETYCLYDDTNYFVPAFGFKLMDLSLYLNHSSNPNLVSVNDGEEFEALVTIPAGTELTVDYGSIVNTEEYKGL